MSDLSDQFPFHPIRDTQHHVTSLFQDLKLKPDDMGTLFDFLVTALRPVIGVNDNIRTEQLEKIRIIKSWIETTRKHGYSHLPDKEHVTEGLLCGIAMCALPRAETNRAMLAMTSANADNLVLHEGRKLYETLAWADEQNHIVTSLMLKGRHQLGPFIGELAAAERCRDVNLTLLKKKKAGHGLTKPQLDRLSHSFRHFEHMMSLSSSSIADIYRMRREGLTALTEQLTANNTSNVVSLFPR